VPAVRLSVDQFFFASHQRLSIFAHMGNYCFPLRDAFEMMT
jgi:hypothetical protein